MERLRALPAVMWAEPAGDIRRAEEMIEEIHVVAATADPSAAKASIEDLSNIGRVTRNRRRRLELLTDDETRIEVWFEDPEHAGSTLLHVTGSGAHLRALRSHASERGWRLTSKGLRGPDGRLRPGSTEQLIYEELRLPFVPPEIRDGHDEIVAAAEGVLPRLLERQDVRGDLHMHTTWSDGQDSTADMVTRCRELGYEYIAITDHSPRSGAPRVLGTADVAAQADEIGELRERFPEMAILHGCEVDIMPDGTLDFPDHILEQFDIVLASLHQPHGQSRDELLGRYEAAMRHPLVTVITHPTNRFVPYRPGYDLDYDRLFEVAVETGTYLEIDGAPGHLDMNGALARRAVAAGASVTVDSDCHRAALLARQMNLGVAMARRGWVEPPHVLNTRSVEDVRSAIARKRGNS